MPSFISAHLPEIIVAAAALAVYFAGRFVGKSAATPKPVPTTLPDKIEPAAIKTPAPAEPSLSYVGEYPLHDQTPEDSAHAALNAVLAPKANEDHAAAAKEDASAAVTHVSEPVKIKPLPVDEVPKIEADKAAKAHEVLDKAKVFGAVRLGIIAKVRTGELTVDDVARAHAAQTGLNGYSGEVTANDVARAHPEQK